MLTEDFANPKSPITTTRKSIPRSNPGKPNVMRN